MDKHSCITLNNMSSFWGRISNGSPNTSKLAFIPDCLKTANSKPIASTKPFSSILSVFRLWDKFLKSLIASASNVSARYSFSKTAGSSVFMVLTVIIAAVNNWPILSCISCDIVCKVFSCISTCEFNSSLSNSSSFKVIVSLNNCCFFL